MWTYINASNFCSLHSGCKFFQLQDVYKNEEKGVLLLLNFQLKMSSFITKQSFYGVPFLRIFFKLCIHQSKLDDKSPHQVAFFHTTSNLGFLADDGHPVIDSGNKASKLQRFHCGYPYNRLIIDYFWVMFENCDHLYSTIAFYFFIRKSKSPIMSRWNCFILGWSKNSKYVIQNLLLAKCL